MADFTIASRIGQGVGQNAFAGGGANPNTMMQLMQLQQTMALQRAAEQRALAGEARAQALHGPALEAANLRVQEAKLGLGTAERTAEDAETADRALKYMADNPDWASSYNTLRKSDAKLWNVLDTTAQKKVAADAAAASSRIDYDKKRFDLNNHLADTMAAVAPTVKDQASYERWLKPLLQNNPEIANSLPVEYSPENFGVAKSVVDRLRQFKVVRLPTGDDAVFDPVEKKFISTLTEAGPQPYAGPQRAFSPSVAATDVAAGRQPMGMMAPAASVNAMAPVVAAQLMQQNAMAAPQQTLPNIAPGLTPAQRAKAAGIEAEAAAREKGTQAAKKEAETESKERTRAEFDTNLDAILGAYKQLGTGGMLITKETPFAERAKTAVMANLPVGATTAISPERGEPYGIIQNNRQIMLSALMGATGMTAKQIDSNAEMKNWLNALSSPDQTAGSILTTLNTLSKRFGSGRQFSENDLGVAPQGRGKAGETPAAGKPSLQEFLAKAKPLNPNASEADLKSYYERTYGAR